jgi:hypothetical protein
VGVVRLTCDRREADFSVLVPDEGDGFVNVRARLLEGGVYRLVYDGPETSRRYRDAMRLHAQLQAGGSGRVIL